MDITSAAKAGADQVFKILDRVTEFRFALILISFVAFFDAFLSIYFHRNIITVNWAAVSDNVGLFGLAAVAYIYWMAVLSLTARIPLEWLGRQIVVSKLGCFLFSSGDKERPTRKTRLYWGQVWVSEAKEKALKEKDAFWIARIEKHEEFYNKGKEEMNYLSSISFSATCLLLLDWGLHSDSLAGVLINWLSMQSNHIDSIGNLILWLCVLLIALPWLFSFFPRSEQGEWIDHPELAGELRKLEDERRTACAPLVHNHFRNAGK